MPIIIKKAMASNITYIVQELHTFPIMNHFISINIFTIFFD